MPEFMIRIEDKTECADNHSFIMFGNLVAYLRSAINDAGFDFICTGLAMDVVNAWIAEQEMIQNLKADEPIP